MARKKLILGFFIGMIGITVTSLSMSLAWYASSNYLRVDPVNIAIQADRTLLLSTTNEREDFKSSLSLQDGDLRYSGLFAPVSSIRSEDWISTRADTPAFYDCAYYWGSVGEPRMEEITREDAYYYSEEFYLYADDDVYVTIDTDLTKIYTNQSAVDTYAKTIFPDVKKEHPEETVEDIIAKLNLLPLAMRFSILVTGGDCYEYYVIDPNKDETDEEVLFGGVLDNSKNDYYDTYTDNGEIYETVYGDVNDRNLIVYNEEVEAEDSILTGEISAFNAKHQQGTHRFNYEASVANGMKFAKEKSISYPELKANPELIKIPVHRGYENTRRLVISIYIEGWDLRSINSTMGSTFMANLSFKILREGKL